MSKRFKISAANAKNRLGEYIEPALRELICVQKSGRDSVVILDSAEYERLIGF